MIAVLAVAVLTIADAYRGHRHQASLSQRIGKIHALPAAGRVDCRGLARLRPLMLLALGQSNAANHGPDVSASAAPAVRVLHEGQCAWMQEPLAGATGLGANLWAHLPAALAAAGVQRPVVLTVLAVESTSVVDWAAPGGMLRRRLQQQLDGIKAAGLQPDLVLWQQGEADAAMGTPSRQYAEHLQTLAGQLAQAGVHAPILLAKSTVCRSAPSEALAQAIDELIHTDARFAAGAATDALVEPWARRDGCHFSLAGLNAAARMWAEIIAQQPGLQTSEKRAGASRPVTA